MTWWRHLAVLFLIVGIVLSPSRAAAATTPMLIAYEAAVQLSPTTALGRHDAVRSEAKRPCLNAYDCDAALFGYDDAPNRRMIAGAGGVHAYDGALEHADQREVRGEAAIYAATAIAIAAKGGGGGGGGIDQGKQDKHIPGTNNYIPGRSILTADPAELAKQAGTGRQIGNTPIGQPGSKEWINFGRVIGDYVDINGNSAPTTNGIIHYATNGFHIVPAVP